MNNTIRDLKYKIFQSGNPLYFYIGLNTLIFLVTAIIAVILFLGNSGFEMSEWIRAYFGLPALFSALPSRFYTVITYMFFHEGFLHLLFNMLGIFWFGNIFMNFLKARQFHFVYISGGIVGAVIYVLGLNILPVFSTGLAGQTVIGSSAAVMAIIVATATLIPNYSIMLLFFGEVKIKWIAIAYFLISFLGLSSGNAGGNLAHIGGALLGFLYINRLQNGSDWSKIFERKPKLKVVKNDKPVTKKPVFNEVSQQEIDDILDKISSSGYDKLSATEKEKLFKASKD